MDTTTVYVIKYCSNCQHSDISQYIKFDSLCRKCSTTCQSARDENGHCGALAALWEQKK